MSRIHEIRDIVYDHMKLVRKLQDDIQKFKQKRDNSALRDLVISIPLGTSIATSPSPVDATKDHKFSTEEYNLRLRIAAVYDDHERIAALFEELRTLFMKGE